MGNSNLLNDCSNAHLMDEFDSYSNAGGGGGNADTYAQAGQATVGLISSLIANKKPKTDLESNIKAVCGKKPLLNIGGKKTKWQECSANIASQASAATPSQNQYVANPPSNNNSAAQDKILGMPKGVGIAVIVVGILGVATVGFLLYKKSATPTTIPIPNVLKK
jgi:hypothetical protein